MSTRIDIVQRIEHNLESREPLDVVLLILDIGMMRDQLCSRIKLLSHFFRNQRFRFLDVFVSEEKLAIEIAEIYRIEIDNVYFAKARLDQIFK